MSWTIFCCPAVSNSIMKWHELNPSRLAIEKRLLAQYHSGAKIIIKGGKMRVIKQIVTSRNTYLIEAIFADRHPYSPMQVYIREPRLKKKPEHMYSGGQLCLHKSNEVGPGTTAKVYLDWTVQWILTYERWLEGGKWPKTNRG